MFTFLKKVSWIVFFGEIETIQINIDVLRRLVIKQAAFLCENAGKTAGKFLCELFYTRYLTIPSSRYNINAKGGNPLNAQFKKGVLELIVLETVKHKDMYGYELVEEVSKVIDVNEGTIYPLLRRLTNEQYFETYLVESSEGPPRKYYHLTAKGVLYSNTLYQDWDDFQAKVNAFFRGVEHE